MDEIAADVNGERWDCSILFKIMPFAPLKYLIMGIKTLRKLFKEEPNVVIAQNPPIFLPLVCWVYSMFSNCMLVVDHHCVWSVKTIRYPVLRDFVAFWERFVARHAELNISPHDVWTGMLGGFGDVRTFTVIDYVREVKVKKISRDSICGTRYLVVYPGGSGGMERPDLAVEAVQGLDDVTLVVTGDKQYLKSLLSFENDRIVFTGFLPRADYYGIMEASDFVINLTEEPYTIPHFIYEAIALGKPVISSPDEALERTFNDYLYILENIDVEDVKMQVRDMLDNLDFWAEKACLLHEVLRHKRGAQIEKLKSEIAGRTFVEKRHTHMT